MQNSSCASSPPCSQGNLANAIDCLLNQSLHDWQYCFLERGGDAGETLLNAQELLESSKHLAALLVNRVPETKVIVLSVEHGPDFLIALIACIFAKRIVVPMPIPRFELHSDRFTKVLDEFNDVIVLTKHKYFESFKKIWPAEKVFKQSTFLCTDILKSKVSPPMSDLPGYTASPDTPLIIQFTSGSTSSPKGVVITSENVLSNHFQVASRWGFADHKSLLSWLPHFHDMGLFGGLLYPLLSGMKMLQMDPMHFIQKPVRWLRAISKYNVQFSGGPAFAFELCNELDTTQLPMDLNLSCWEVAFCGADYVPARTLNQFRSSFANYHLNPSSVIPVYGLAEATLFVAGQPGCSHKQAIEYEGNHTEGCYLGLTNKPDVFICEEDGDRLQNDGTIGEICVKGSFVSKGYYGLPSTTDNRVLRTGDLGFIKDNFLFISSRIKDIIVINGQNISPAIIEQIAASTSNVLNPHAAAAFQEESASTDIVLLIEVKKGKGDQIEFQEEIRSKIRNQIQQRQGINVGCIKFLKRGELQKTSSGKVQRQLVAKAYFQGHRFREIENDNC